MYESFRTRSCVSLRIDRKSRFAVVHTLLSLMMCLCLACATPRDTDAPCPVIEMRAVSDTPTDSSTPLVSTSDITGATASQADGEWTLNVTVTDDAAKRLHDFTEQHVGKKLALVVGGKVHDTPRIASAITGNRYQISGLNRTDAERMATAISTGCRR